MKYSLIVEVTPLAVYINKISSEYNKVEEVDHKNFSSNKKVNELLTNDELIRLIAYINYSADRFAAQNKNIKILIYGNFYPLNVNRIRMAIKAIQNYKISVTYLDIKKIKILYKPYTGNSKMALVFIGSDILILYKNQYRIISAINDVHTIQSDLAKHEINIESISAISLFMNRNEYGSVQFDNLIKSLLDYFPYAVVKSEDLSICDTYLSYAIEKTTELPKDKNSH